jgi:C-terminal processing protease CtpA/Prc
METPVSTPEAGRALYHAVWKVVAANFFDRTRLADWDSWEHKFDDQILDEASALPKIDLMLASLNDPYTAVVPKAAAQPASADSDASHPEDASAIAQPAAVMSVLRADGIGYLQILNFDNEEIFDQIEAAVAKIADCRGLIVDVRPNSGGRMHRAIQACALFIENGVITTVELPHESGGLMQRQYCVTADQFFCNDVAPDGTETNELYERPRPVMANKPTVVLIHRKTASAAEMFACALVMNGTEGKMLTVGGNTAGKGIGQVDMDVLNGKLTLKITRSRWLTPGGDWLGDCRQTVYNPIEPNISVADDRGVEGFKVALAEMKKMLGIDVQ